MESTINLILMINKRFSLTLQITDSSSHTLYSKEDAVKGKFAFTTEDYDMFEVCFESKSPMGKCLYYQAAHRHYISFLKHQKYLSNHFLSGLVFFSILFHN